MKQSEAATSRLKRISTALLELYKRLSAAGIVSNWRASKIEHGNFDGLKPPQSAEEWTFQVRQLWVLDQGDLVQIAGSQANAAELIKTHLQSAQSAYSRYLARLKLAVPLPSEVLALTGAQENPAADQQREEVEQPAKRQRVELEMKEDAESLPSASASEQPPATQRNVLKEEKDDDMEGSGLERKEDGDTDMSGSLGMVSHAQSPGKQSNSMAVDQALSASASADLDLILNVTGLPRELRKEANTFRVRRACLLLLALHEQVTHSSASVAGWKNLKWLEMQSIWADQVANCQSSGDLMSLLNVFEAKAVQWEVLESVSTYAPCCAFPACAYSSCPLISVLQQRGSPRLVAAGAKGQARLHPHRWGEGGLLWRGAPSGGAGGTEKDPKWKRNPGITRECWFALLSGRWPLTLTCFPSGFLSFRQLPGHFRTIQLPCARWLMLRTTMAMASLMCGSSCNLSCHSWT